MKVYNEQHSYYCGIDLHARTMYVCILDNTGKKVYHKNIRCKPEYFLQAIEPFRGDLVVGVECIFCWYWLALWNATKWPPDASGDSTRAGRSVPGRRD